MRNTILIVDDVSINREILGGILEEDYMVLEACDGITALTMVKENKDSLCAILLDLLMPNMSGYEVLRHLNERGYMTTIPVLIISTEDSVLSERECFNEGVTDFIRKPFDAHLVRTRVNNVVNLFLYKEHLEETVEEQTGIIRRWNTNIIDFLGNVVESRNLESGLHIQRVKGYTKILAEELMEMYPEYGLTKKTVEIIVDASSLHDVGKIAIPDAILLKPGKLTEEEFIKMKEHTTLGGEFIKGVTDMWDEEYGKASYEIARYHHEKYDGKGYPEGLKGEDIPIAAQIVSVADIYDALVSARCYKNAYDQKTAFRMIIDGDCGEINPKLVHCLKNKISEFEELAKSS